MADAGTISFKLLAETSRFQKALKDALKDLDGFKKKTKETTDVLALLKDKWSLLHSVMAGAAVYQAAQAFMSTVNAASALEEQTNLLNVTFAENTDQVLAWSKTFSDSTGLAQSQIQGLAGQFGAVLKPLTGSLDAATEMSTAMAQLAVDTASFRNLRIEDTLEKLRSGLSGESEPLKQLGVVMTEATLQAYALKQGITAKVESLSIAQKTALRYGFILEGLRDAQGDATNTAGSYANSVRRLEGAFQKMQEEAGNRLLPAMTDLVNELARLVGASEGAATSLADAFVPFIEAITEGIRKIIEFKQEISGVLRLAGKIGKFAMQVLPGAGLLPGSVDAGDFGAKPAEALPKMDLVPLVKPFSDAATEGVRDLFDRMEKVVTQIDFSKMDWDGAFDSIKGQGQANLESLNRAFGETASAAAYQARVSEANAKLQQALMVQEEEILNKRQDATDKLVSQIGQALAPAFGKLSGTVQALFEKDWTGAILQGAGAILASSQSARALARIFDDLVQVLARVIDVVAKPLGALSAKFHSLVTSSEQLEAEQQRFLAALRKGIQAVIDQVHELQFESIIKSILSSGDLSGMSEAQLKQIQALGPGILSELEKQLAMIEFGIIEGDADAIRAQIAIIKEGLEEGGEILKDTVNGMNEQLTNVPSGLKVALTRFRSTIGAGAASGVQLPADAQSFLGDPAARGEAKYQVNISNVNVSTDMFQEFIQQITDEATRAAVAQSGPTAYVGQGGTSPRNGAGRYV